MDNALKANDGEETGCDGGSCNGDEDEQTEQASSVAAALALEEDVGARDGGVDGHGGVAGVMDGEVQATNNSPARCRFDASMHTAGRVVSSGGLGATCPPAASRGRES